VILIVSGAGGVGKGTVVQRLVELYPDLALSRSWTTRARRPGEPEDAYVFVDRATFERHREAGGFLEWTEFPGNGHLYGTPMVEVSEPRDTVLEIELNGAQQVQRQRPDAIVVMIVAPTENEREDRLRARGDDESSVARRLTVGAQEQELGRRIADHIVVNDDVDRAAREVAGILRTSRGGAA
jgi:guanylate kinase